MRPRSISFGPLAVAIVVAGVALLTNACSDSGASDDSQAQNVSSQTTVPPTDTADDSIFDFTSTITITDTGFEPLQAVAVLGETLTFINETTSAQTIRFINGAPNVTGSTTIGPIAPGESISMTEPLNSTISLIYESDGLPGKQGHLQIDPGIDTI